MKRYFICGLLLTLFVYFANGSTDEERRFREGNSFSRKMRSCGLFCSLKGNRASYNQTRCYRIPSQNVVATDCVFRCLRSKGESPVAEECNCINGVCEEKTTTTPPETDGTISEPSETTTESATTENPTANPTNRRKNTHGNGNQGKKGVKGKNSKNSNQSSKQKS